MRDVMQMLLRQPALLIRSLLYSATLHYLHNLCRDQSDPLCSSTITPKHRTVIDENIYFTEVSNS